MYAMRGAARATWSTIKYIPGVEDLNKEWKTKFERETSGRERREARDGGRRSADQAGGEVDRRTAPGRPPRRPRQTPRRGLAALRTLSPPHGLFLPPPPPAGPAHLSDAP